jgi:uncharacterized Fe-S cluster-containing radical SAM superfamily enzyme
MGRKGVARGFRRLLPSPNGKRARKRRRMTWKNFWLHWIQRLKM